MREIRLEYRPYIAKLACRYNRPDIITKIFRDETNTYHVKQLIIDEVIMFDNLLVFKELNVNVNEHHLLHCITSGSDQIFEYIMRSKHSNNIDYEMLFHSAILHDREYMVEALIKYGEIFPSPEDIVNIINEDKVKVLRRIFYNCRVCIGDGSVITIKSFDMYELIKLNGYNFTQSGLRNIMHERKEQNIFAHQL